LINKILKDKFYRKINDSKRKKESEKKNLEKFFLSEIFFGDQGINKKEITIGKG